MIKVIAIANINNFPWVSEFPNIIFTISILYILNHLNHVF